MASYTYPGVYIQELESAVHTISGVATSIAVFVGWAPMGSSTSATLVQSYTEYAAKFGGLDPRSYLGYSVNQFFANGGQQAYIVRLVAPAIAGPVGTATAAAIQVTAPGGSVTFAAKAPGAWGNAYAVQIGASSDKVAGHVKASVVYAPAGMVLSVLESFDNLDLNGLKGIASQYITVAVAGATAPPAQNAAGSVGYQLSGGTDGDAKAVPAAAAAQVAISGITFDSTAAVSRVSLTTTTTANTGLVLAAKNPGAWGNAISVTIQPFST